MSDYIKRSDAIKAVIADAKLKNLLTGNCEDEKAIEGMVYGVLCPRDVPSADVVNKSDFNRIKEERDYAINQLQEHGIWIMRNDRIIEVEDYEWCTDCKEYDKERHCCPMWNKVIRDTMDEIRQKAEENWDKVDVVRCKDCKWYEPKHILHSDGTKTYVNECEPDVTVDVGINVSGQCVNHNDLKIHCTAHDRENPSDYENIVMFRKPDDYCSYGERTET